MRGAWIETLRIMVIGGGDGGSLPMRGAWIETIPTYVETPCPAGRSPCGERGLKRIVLLMPAK